MLNAKKEEDEVPREIGEPEADFTKKETLTVSDTSEALWFTNESNSEEFIQALFAYKNRFQNPTNIISRKAFTSRQPEAIESEINYNDNSSLCASGQLPAITRGHRVVKRALPCTFEK